MHNLIAIGGGELKDLETLPLDREIVKLTGKKRPKALFLPTASRDSQGYADTFSKVYGKRLGCKTDILTLWRERPSEREIRERILESDLIYVGGGNTLAMLKLWRRLRVDSALRKAYEQGTVLSGLSAGAICWFRYGSSDSRRFQNTDDKALMRLSGLGFYPLTLSPHHLSEPHRKQGLIDMMRKTPGVALALDDNAALEIVGEEYRILASRDGVRAHKVYLKKGEISYLPLLPSLTFHPLEELIRKE